MTTFSDALKDLTELDSYYREDFARILIAHYHPELQGQLFTFCRCDNIVFGGNEWCSDECKADLEYRNAHPSGTITWDAVGDVQRTAFADALNIIREAESSLLKSLR